MIPCECCCDDKKVRDLEKKVNKAVYSVAVNGEIIYPTDGVGNVNLGDIGGSTDARDIKMPDGTSVAVNIDDLNTAVKDAVSEVVPTPVTDGINLNETDGNGTVSRMLIRADDTLKFDGLNVGISDKTDTRITEALNTATNAGNKADDAQADADDAMTAANKAVINLNTSMDIADDYLKYTLNEAHNNGVTGKTSLFAVDRADLNMMNVADTFPVLQLSDDAKTKINGAISAIGASVVDTALEMNIDKADGSTATEQLFSIGDGLEWVEGVLKATGGSGGMTYYSGNINTFPDGLYFVTSMNVDYIQIANKFAINTGTYGGEIHPTGASPLISYERIYDSFYAHGIIKVYNKAIDYAILTGDTFSSTPQSISIKVSIDGGDETSAKANAIIIRSGFTGSNIIAATPYLYGETVVYYDGASCVSPTAAKCSTTSVQAFKIA